MINIEEYWNKYISGDLISIYPETKELFLKKLPKKFLNEYAYDELILETAGELENIKDFDKLVEFIQILQNKQPEIFKDIYHYPDCFLIDYYCFHSKHDMLIKPINDFIKAPVNGIDNLIRSFKLLIYYQYTEEADKLTKSTYHIIKESEEVMPGAELELAYLIFFIDLENEYKNSLSGKRFNRKKIIKSSQKYDLTLSDDLLNCFETALTNEKITSELIKETCKSNLNKMNFLYESFFFIDMYKKGMSFAVSGFLWSKCYEYWYDVRSKSSKSAASLFKLKKESFTEFLDENSGDFFIDNSSEIAMIIWGIQYIYDFLFENGCIDEKTYRNCTKIILQNKAKFIKDKFNDLWKFSFVHRWLNDTVVISDEFVAEKQFFEKTHYLELVLFGTNPLLFHSEAIKEYLEKMVSLKNYLS